MKTFTRSSSKLLSSTEPSPEKSQPPSQPASRKPRGNSQQLQAAVESKDPYSFVLGIEEDQVAARPEQPGPSKVTATKGEAWPQAKPASRRAGSNNNTATTTATAAAAARPASKAPPQPAEQRQPGPSPPKQPRAAGAQHVASSAAQQVAPQQQPHQELAAPPAGKAAAAARTVATNGRAEKAAGSGGLRGGASGGARQRANSSSLSSGKAASGGNSRKPATAAVAGSKRSRAGSDLTNSQQQQQQQQQPQQRSNSSPPESLPSSFASPDPTSNSAGALSLPTPHRRPRLAAGLLAAAAAGGTEGRPAQTVMEAQERGELVQMQDDASYAMDGLAATCSIDTQRDSAVTLTEMLSTRKGRVALRTDGLAQQFLTNLAKLKAAKDCVLGLAATLSLWYLSAEDANPCYLASVAAAVLVDQLLQHDYTFDEVSAKSAAGAKLCRLLRLRPLTNLLTSTAVDSSRGLLLITLEQATNSQHASKAAAVEKLKHNLRQHGALARLAGLVADTAAAPGGPVAAAKQLHVLLLVLENATFTCPENGTALAELQTGRASSKGSAARIKQQQQQQQQGKAGSEDAAAAGGGQGKAFPAVLVGVAQQLLQGVDQEETRAALHALLSVMMNLIHDNKQGGALLCSAGGMDVAADTYSRLLLPSAASQEALCGAVLKHLELVSVALGVLMNLVSNEPQHSKQLAAAGGDRSNGGSGHVSSFVQLLCTVMSALGQLLQHQQDPDDPRKTAAAGAAAGSQPELGAAAAAAAAAAAGPTIAAQVVTSPSAAAEALGSNTASEASIVEVYSGILLGFLVRDGGPPLAQAVCALLPGRSLDALTSATGRCLDFYVRTGAITDHTRVTLELLLRQLEGLRGQVEGGGAQQQQQQPVEVMDIDE